jgi:hypothetical protein
MIFEQLAQLLIAVTTTTTPNPRTKMVPIVNHSQNFSESGGFGQDSSFSTQIHCLRLAKAPH